MGPVVAASVPQFSLRCVDCGGTATGDASLLTCPVCSAEQEPGGTVRGVLEWLPDDLPASRPVSEIAADPNWWRDFMPLGRSGRRSPHPVGQTPWVHRPRAARHFGVRDLWLKDDTRNHSGSTKDRASELVVAQATALGRSVVATASTGNAATALAAMAATADLPAVVLVPASAPVAKLVQMRVYGARVIAVDGTYDEAFELCNAACETYGWYNRNTGLNPWTIEGKKSVALEMAAQSDFEPPDVVVVPTGDGVILSGVAKGFDDLLRAGWIRRRPRLLAVQPEGSAAVARAWADGAETPALHAGASSVADSLVVSMPRNGRLCLRRIRESEGAVVTVSEDEILAAIVDMARLGGIFAEPAAAAGWAGLAVARRRGHVTAQDRVALLVTGTGLKDVAVASRASAGPDATGSPVPADLESLSRALAPSLNGEAD